MQLQNYRTLLVLTLAQCFGQTAAPILVLLGGIVGTQLAPSPDLATLPIAIQIIGIASAAMPASFFMAKAGRRLGFLLATALAILAALLAAHAVASASFFRFCVASFLLGNYIAFLQQFRFAVAESVPTAEVPKCLSILMLAGIVAALLGPEVGRRFSVVAGLPMYVGSFLGMAALLTLSFIILLLFYRNSKIQAKLTDDSPRPLPEIFRQPRIILAVAAAAIGYSVMSLVMTATPVSMHELHGYSLDETTRVIQSHILAMYIPSFFSGLLITRFGAPGIIKWGIGLMFGCVIIGWGEPAFIHYWGALVCLGIGWNFLFLGGTTLLTQSYRGSERFKVQAVNDFLVFGLQAAGSLSAGVLLATLGWLGVMALVLPALLLLAPIVYMERRSASA